MLNAVEHERSAITNAHRSYLSVYGIYRKLALTTSRAERMINEVIRGWATQSRLRVGPANASSRAVPGAGGAWEAFSNRIGFDHGSSRVFGRVTEWRML